MAFEVTSEDSEALSVLTSALFESQTPKGRETTEHAAAKDTDSQESPFKRRKVAPLNPLRSKRLWAEARLATGSEVIRTKAGARIWYCKRCLRYPGTPNHDNARTHLRREHGVIITEDPTKLQKEIDKQTKRLFQAENAQLDQPFENRMRNTVNSEAVNRALVNLVTRRNLPHNCVQWPELHALIQCFNFAASDVLIRSYNTLRQRIELQFGIKLGQLKQELRYARSNIHFTIDTWTTPNHIELQAITGHLVSNSVL